MERLPEGEGGAYLAVREGAVWVVVLAAVVLGADREGGREEGPGDVLGEVPGAAGEERDLSYQQANREAS